MEKVKRRGYKILIVDDVPQNIQVLANILKDAGYQIGFAQDGKTALTHTNTTTYDLILLDIMMPDMDGYKVCELMKNSEKTKDIPIIFITAKDETSNKTRGFQLGAVDYITKPFDALEVLARIKTHLTIREYATSLELLVEERTQQLVHADRLATLGMFSAAIAHEIKNPLSYISGNVQFFKLFFKIAEPILERHIDEDSTGRMQKDLQEVRKKMEDIFYGIKIIAKLIDNLRSYSREKETLLETIPLINIVNDAINIIGHKLKFKNIEPHISISPDINIFCNSQKLIQVFINIIDNSCNILKNLDNGRIEIRAEELNDKIDINISDNGPGVPREIERRIFAPFFTTKNKDEGTGLGLFIVSNIIKEHGGKIELLPYNGKGAKFHITLPKG